MAIFKRSISNKGDAASALYCRSLLLFFAFIQAELAPKEGIE